TVLTYNIQQGSALNGDQRYREQLELIRKIDPDIIGLQESDTPRPSGGNVDVVRFFAEGLDYYSYYGPSVISGTFGTAILSRFPIENPRSIFTYSTVDETGTAVAEIFAGSRRIAFFNNHPAGPPVTHHAHIDGMLDAARDYDHVIAVGDFNFRPDSPYYAKAAAVLTESWKVLHPDGAGPRNPDLDPDAAQGGLLHMDDRIDLIFFDGDLGVVDAWYLPPPASQTDHPAYWATLDLK
ncbi:MAG: endonuclease/exonuclease/phosphatase family protein, partial [Candidatus Hydrogenedentes bacterium]|nr:endonuclease/exonuclease/phosphatase family protein [Candidatus Hydrogenedentota bacterium]